MTSLLTPSLDSSLSAASLQDPISQAIAAYDRSSLHPRLEAAEAQRADILKRFPKDGWPALPLERYALGQSDVEDTFCRWLEFKSNDLGSISGGSSKKLGIFKRRDRDGWYYPQKSFSTLQDAWTALRQGLTNAIRLAGQGEWQEIDALQIWNIAPALSLKTLHLYYPSEILPIYTRKALRHFLRIFHKSDEETRSSERVALNRMLLAAVRAHPALQGWSTNEVMFFLYDTFDPREVRRVVKIAPGENARYWSDCLAGGYICVGWDDVGDLTDFQSKSEFNERFAATYASLYQNNRSKINAKANELWLLYELEPGDVVIANQGISKVLAVGTVEEPGYEWREDRPEYRHTVRVRWDTSLARSIAPQRRWGTVTVARVPAELYKVILSGSEMPSGDPRAGQPATRLATSLDPELGELMETLECKGQLILYGPPGTGKTYTACRLATAFLLRQQGEDAAAVLADPARYVEAERTLATGRPLRRAWWVVANPREWQWEQLFAKGHQAYRLGRIKRNYAMLQQGDLVIGYQSTPDKRIVALASISNPSLAGEDDTGQFEIAPIARVSNGPTYEELMNDLVIAASEPMRFRSQGTLFALTAVETERLLGLILERDPSLHERLPDEEDEVPPLTRLTFHPSYSYEDFIEGFRPYNNGTGSLALRLEDGVFKRVCAEARLHRDRAYVLLIDEINRANLSKVFGEIITLLERDKRDLAVTLPQSKESFTVPSNVYMIGTMNTADRSIRLLDAALRRRFAFAEMMPSSELLRGATVGPLALDEFLEGLNLRIAREAGREKQIGHAFLLDGTVPVTDPTEFARRFRQEILPLLQEYCYEDYAALALYLGDELVDQNAGVINMDIVQDATSLVGALEKQFDREAPAA